jgi:hypothetical protein
MVLKTDVQPSPGGPSKIKENHFYKHQPPKMPKTTKNLATILKKPVENDLKPKTYFWI